MVSQGTASYVPERGHAVWINFDPQAGHEQSGRRPALVLSPTAYNRRIGLVLVCPITTRVKGYPFEVPVPAGLGVTGVVLADQVKSVDWRARRAGFLCVVPDDVMDEVLAKILSLLPYQ